METRHERHARRRASLATSSNVNPTDSQASAPRCHTIVIALSTGEMHFRRDFAEISARDACGTHTARRLAPGDDGGVTARGSGLRICWINIRGCCEAGPPPSMPLVSRFHPLNPERILWLRKRRRRRRRRRPRSRRRSNFPARVEPCSARASRRKVFAKRRALGPLFDSGGAVALILGSGDV